jgi:hypothetical protein
MKFLKSKNVSLLSSQATLDQIYEKQFYMVKLHIYLSHAKIKRTVREKRWIVIIANLLHKYNHEMEDAKSLLLAHPFVQSARTMNAMHHTLVISWMCWEWLLPGGMKIRSSQPDFFSLICIRSKSSTLNSYFLPPYFMQNSNAYLHFFKNIL